jgi:hypothetical protein
VSALPPTDLYHVGLIVDDIDAAAQRLTAVSGYEWTKPVEYTLAVTTADGDYEVPFKFVYSLQAPHLELCNRFPGPSGPPRPIRRHTTLATGLTTSLPQRPLSKTPATARKPAPGGEDLSMFAYQTDPDGVRIEIVDRALFPDFPGFLEAMKA